MRFADCGPVLVRIVTRDGLASGVDDRIAGAQRDLNRIIGNCPKAEFTNAITEKGSVPVESDSDPSRLIVGLGLGLVVTLAALAALTFGRTRPPTSD